MSLKSVRENVAYVAQDVQLFGGSIRDNVRYGRLDASDLAIRDVLRAADAAAFVDALPSGLDTIVGENGTKLSGGERQRIAIARALLRESRILLLDEVTSAVDVESEARIFAAIANHFRTIVLVTHRLTAIQEFDRIIVVDGGKVVDDGNHRELLGRRGLYYELVTGQSSRPQRYVTAGQEFDSAAVR